MMNFHAHTLSNPMEAHENEVKLPIKSNGIDN